MFNPPQHLLLASPVFLHTLLGLCLLNYTFFLISLTTYVRAYKRLHNYGSFLNYLKNRTIDVKSVRNLYGKLSHLEQLQH